MLKEENLVILFNDITESVDERRSNAEQKLQTIYFASVAHDLKTPVNSIYGANQQLKRLTTNP